jgi:hypothetical protein
LPITGEASKHPPTADAMKVSAVDPAFFTGGVWMMSSGSWQIRLEIAGASGEQTASVPVRSGRGLHVADAAATWVSHWPCWGSSW